jgi:hypothetical protein
VAKFLATVRLLMNIMLVRLWKQREFVSGKNEERQNVQHGGLNKASKGMIKGV